MDLNWTFWDLQVKSIDVTLSLWKLMDGKGLLKECIMKGIRGTIDRRHITFDSDWKPSRRHPMYGDFELNNFVLEDMLVSILNPGFRPFFMSVFNAELPCLRKQWLLYDIFCADSIVGQVDNCLFSVHKPQRSDLVVDQSTRGAWAKMSHLKINGLPINHLNAGASGPLSWITSGKIDLDVHLLIPQIPPSDDFIMMIRQEMDGITKTTMNKLEEIVSKHPEREAILEKNKRKLRNYGVIHPPNRDSYFPPLPHGPPSLVMFWNVDLNDIKASVPLISSELSYMNSALIRPVVGFMNNNKTKTHLSFDTKMDVENFNGSWDIYAAGLVNLLSEEIGRAFLTLVQDERERNKRLRQVGLWSLQSVSKNLTDWIEYARNLGTTHPFHWMSSTDSL